MRPLRFPEGRISLSEQLLTVMLDGLLTSLQASFADDPPHPYHFPLQLKCWDGFEGPCPSLDPPWHPTQELTSSAAVWHTLHSHSACHHAVASTWAGGYGLSWARLPCAVLEHVMGISQNPNSDVQGLTGFVVCLENPQQAPDDCVGC